MAANNDKINELIQSVSENNEVALEELFQITKESLLYIAKDYIADASYAEDVLSEAYLKIYRKAHTFNQKYNGFNWLYEIVKNTALDFNRKFFKEQTVSFDETIYIFEEDMRQKLRRKRLRYALKLLDEIEYKVIYLRIWENRTIDSIASIMKLSTAKVYRTYTIAIEKLRKALE